MNQYDEIDRLILERIGRDDQGVELTYLNTNMVRAEAERIANATGRVAYRVLDGRLQALRNREKIKFNSKLGWLLVR
jgi:hypothetical protein